MLVSHNQRVTSLNTEKFYIFFPHQLPMKNRRFFVVPTFESAEKGLCKVASLVVQHQVAEDVCTSSGSISEILEIRSEKCW
jgi:hypothetical protein